MRAEFVGMDSFDRPVYKCMDGTYIKDVDPRPEFGPDLHTSINNEFDGEPDMRIKENVTLLPNRVTW